MSTTTAATKNTKKEGENAVDENNNASQENAVETDKDVQAVTKTMQDVLALSRVDKYKKKVEESDPQKKHVFWDTQPVPKLRKYFFSKMCAIARVN